MGLHDVPAHEYEYNDSSPPCNIEYLQKPILHLCTRYHATNVLDLGCGNGALCGILLREGFQVSGCDPSSQGIDIAQRALPGVQFTALGVYDEPKDLGESNFDVVVSTEVIEHLYLPRYLPRFAAQVLKPGGLLIISTPYHGYLKNLILSLLGKWDSHHTALWDGGHIKFWSKRTLAKLLFDEGFDVDTFVGVGRCAHMWKSMIVVAKKRD